MSEYQYYEFAAIDRPLTREQMTQLRALSSRATITPTRFCNIYNWGDYTNPKLIEKFTKMYNVKVRQDDYDSNETMLSKVRAGSTG